MSPRSFARARPRVFLAGGLPRRRCWKGLRAQEWGSDPLAGVFAVRLALLSLVTLLPQLAICARCSGVYILPCLYGFLEGILRLLDVHGKNRDYSANRIRAGATLSVDTNDFSDNRLQAMNHLHAIRSRFVHNVHNRQPERPRYRKCTVHIAE